MFCCRRPGIAAVAYNLLIRLMYRANLGVGVESYDDGSPRRETETRGWGHCAWDAGVPRVTQAWEAEDFEPAARPSRHSRRAARTPV